MAQIQVTDLTFSYEGSFDNIFEHSSFSIDTDWKLGLIGRNGKGKTTLLNLLLGKYSYAGHIHTSTVFDYFPYGLTEEQKNLPAAEFLEDLKAGCEQWRVLWELEQLSEDAALLYRPFGTLSHGERIKVLLAVLFSKEQEFLLIDEPTSHLDSGAKETVKTYLASKKGFILVSHDRDLLDACIDHVLVLNRKSIEIQKGNFSSWWENRQRKDQFEKTENEKHLKEIGKLRQAAARTGAWADQNEKTKIGYDPAKEPDHANRAFIGEKTRKMQSRTKALKNRIEREIKEKEGLLADLEEPAELKMMPLVYHKNTLITVRDYSVMYEDAKKPVFTNLSFTLNRGERIALHGRNGCGKSTLLRLLMQRAAGQEQPKLSVRASGVCETASGLVISYVNQDTSMLKGSIRNFCMERNLEEHLFFAVLRQLDLDRVQFGKPMEEQSEGQKKKILIAASLLTPAHLYVWDEPLNYVDVFSRMQIEKMLLSVRPTMLFVDHDVRFQEKIATGVVEMSGGL